jgi:hypothetical protein
MVRNVKRLLLAVGVLGLTIVRSGDTAGQQKAVPPPAPVPARVDDAVRKQWEARYGSQVRQLHRMELHFMRLVTEPTRQQYEKIAADTEPTVKAAIAQLVEGLAGGRGVQSDPREPIAEGIAKSVRANLSSEQAARYQKEIDLRAAAHKRLFVTSLVAMTDRVLVLRPDQREQLAKILAENWNESWNQTQILTYGGQYFPQMPDAKINPILTDAQRPVWRGISKGNIRFGMNFGFVQGTQVEDEVWDDDPPAKQPDRPNEKAAPSKPAPLKSDDKP